jgi:hypothetical protein
MFPWVILLLTCTYEDGTEAVWALPQGAAFDLLGLLRERFGDEVGR